MLTKIIATFFVRASEEQRTAVQLSTIHKNIFLCQNNDFKPVSTEVITSMFHMATLALVEEENVLSYIGSDICPFEMKTFRDKVLRSTVLGRDIKDNDEKDNDIHRCRMKIFKRHFQVRYKN